MYSAYKLDPCQDQRDNKFGTKGSCRRELSDGHWLEASDYEYQALPLTKGWYKIKVSVYVTENMRKPFGMSTVDQEPKAGYES